MRAIVEKTQTAIRALLTEEQLAKVDAVRDRVKERVREGVKDRVKERVKARREGRAGADEE